MILLYFSKSKVFGSGYYPQRGVVIETGGIEWNKGPNFLDNP